ncbi:MAG TPA: SurA N-terminal domain-containing protein, partial [Myxococcaceae bacterium]|nr:SurA N-terminal domain-containing protein [Myxococcaceae bacterium]
RSIFSTLIILAIAVVFVTQWGPGAKGCDIPWRQKATVSSAALVNGKEISLRDFQRRYMMALQNVRAQNNIPESLARQIISPKQVIDFMVDRELLSQAAERHGLTASDEEIRNIVYKQPDFQKDGQFDVDRYREILATYYRQTEPEYEDNLRRQLSAQKMVDLLENSAVVADDEVRARFMKEGNKAQLTFVRFLPAMFADKVSAPTEAQVDAYAKEHVKQISDYYDANKSVYHQPERAHVAQILIKASPEASADQRAAARTKIDSVRKQLDAGKEFALLAKQVSEDLGSKGRGGDLGFVERSALPPELAQAVFSMKPGEVSQPLETHLGFHVVKLEEIRPAEDKPLAAVQNEIARQLYVRERSKALAEAEAAKALSELKSGKKLDALYPAEKSENAPSQFNFDVESKPQAVDTGEFNSSANTLPKLGPAPALMTDALARSEPGVLDRVYPVGEASVVADLTLRAKPTDAEFNGEHDKLRQQALDAKRIELRESFVRALHKSANLIINDPALQQQNPAPREEEDGS